MKLQFLLALSKPPPTVSVATTSTPPHHGPQELGSFPTPLTPASTTAGEVSFHYKMVWTTTIAWLLQLTRKKTRWKEQEHIFRPHETLRTPIRTQANNTRQANDDNRVKYGYGDRLRMAPTAAIRPYDAIFFPAQVHIHDNINNSSACNRSFNRSKGKREREPKGTLE